MTIAAIHRSSIATTARRLFAAGRLAAVAAGLTGYCAMSVAATPPMPSKLPQVVVSLQDLNLDADGDLAVLFRRIETAAVQVCPAPDPSVLKEQALAQECRRFAMSRAVDQIGNPRLSALFARHGAIS